MKQSGARWLNQDEIAEEERRLRMALPYFFRAGPSPAPDAAPKK
jgi:hypothetical protein